LVSAFACAVFASAVAREVLASAVACAGFVSTIAVFEAELVVVPAVACDAGCATSAGAAAATTGGASVAAGVVAAAGALGGTGAGPSGAGCAADVALPHAATQTITTATPTCNSRLTLRESTSRVRACANYSAG
jgi:hypothetical protein